MRVAGERWWGGFWKVSRGCDAGIRFWKGKISAGLYYVNPGLCLVPKVVSEIKFRPSELGDFKICRRCGRFPNKFTNIYLLFCLFR